MYETGIDDIDRYCSLMMSSSGKRREFDRLTAVTISRFFRDRGTLAFFTTQHTAESRFSAGKYIEFLVRRLCMRGRAVQPEYPA